MGEIIKNFLNIFSFFNIYELRQRIISSLTLSLFFMLLFFLGNPIFIIFFSLLFSFIFIEYETLTNTLVKKIKFLKVFILQLFILLFTILEINNLIISNILDNFTFFLFISILINIFFLIYNSENFISSILSNLIILTFFCLVGILFKPNGLFLFLYIVLLVSTMDILAYFGGKLLGKRKIAPKISQGKTIEGTIIGLVFTIFISYLSRDFPNFNINDALLCGFIISILAFFGDIIESLFKRNIGVKDSGNLIPGHGGLLDRFDGYLLAIPFFYFYIN